MNISISKRQNNTKLISLIKTPNKGYFVKFLEVSKYKYNPTEVFNKNDLYNVDQGFYFRHKMEEHFCGKFSIFNNNATNINNYIYNYITFNTNEKEAKTSEFLGKIFNKGKWVNQYANYNYQMLTTKETDKFFIKSTKIKETEKAHEIQELLSESNKIPIIEEKLSRYGEFFSNCIKNTQNIADCYQALMIHHGNDGVIAVKILFPHIFG